MIDGYIKLYRQLLESEIFASQIGLKIWIWCLLKANYKSKFVSIKTGRGKSTIEVERGSFVFGRHKAEEELNIDESTIYKWIKKIEKLEMISVKRNTHYSIITICKYDTYQSELEYDVTTKEQPSNNQVTGKEQPNNTTNKDNKDKKYKNILLSEINSDEYPNLNNEYIEITKEFQKLFRNNLIEAGAKTTTIDKAKGTWIDDIRLIIETDKYTLDDLRQVYKFLQKDDFWKSNILSTSKLRKQMDKLKIQSNNDGRTKQAINRPTSAELNAAIEIGIGLAEAYKD